MDRPGAILLIRRLAAFTGILTLASAGAAHAGGDPGVGAVRCQVVKVCVAVETGGSGGQADSPQGAGTSADSKVACTYTKVDPDPAAAWPGWKGADPEKNDAYFYGCTDGGLDNPDGFVVVPLGQPPVPRVDPRQLAQRAVDSMTLLGPDIASPRAAGKYSVGVPMWMWVKKSATSFGPNTASATAGGVTVTATAKVSRMVWAMGDGASVTCNGPGTAYTSSAGMSQSPTCGHVYSRPSAAAHNGKFTVTATSTWTIDWLGGGQAGRLTEVRRADVQVAVGEVQVVG